MYINQEQFSLHDEDLGYCDLIIHTICTNIDTPVYVPYKVILQQLQVEACECLNT